MFEPQKITRQEFWKTHTFSRFTPHDVGVLLVPVQEISDTVKREKRNISMVTRPDGVPSHNGVPSPNGVPRLNAQTKST